MGLGLNQVMWGFFCEASRINEIQSDFSVCGDIVHFSSARGLNIKSLPQVCIPVYSLHLSRWSRGLCDVMRP